MHHVLGNQIEKGSDILNLTDLTFGLNMWISCIYDDNSDILENYPINKIESKFEKVNDVSIVYIKRIKIAWI